MKKFFEECQVPEPLDPREALYGGRTNAIKLYHKPTNGEELDYVDICSLYPWCCKYGSFPIGKPDIHTRDFAQLTENNQPYKGLISCSVLAPRQLFLPVLPFRANGKLNFPLCATCCKEKWDDVCQHGDNDRKMTGVWTTIELDKALELGYKVMDIKEVNRFSTKCYFFCISLPKLHGGC